MVGRYYIATYWGDRRESATECAQRAARFLPSLAALDDSLRQWSRPRGKAAPCDDTVAWEKALLEGRNRTDTTREVIEELGFMVFMWNTLRHNATDLTLHCGCYGEGAVNMCLLHPPSAGEDRERLLQAPLLARVLTCMAEAWDPDIGVATSHPLRDALHLSRTEDVPGWLMYFSRRRGTVPPLPAPVRIEPVGTLGTLVIVSPERLTASNPEHVALLSRVQKLLKRAGLLRESWG